MDAKKIYEQLFSLSKKIRIMHSITYLLEWDQETYMPPAGFSLRGEQLELMAGIMHKEKTGRAYTQALSKLIDLKNGKVKAKGLNAVQKAALREWRRDYLLATALPNRFVKEFAKVTSEATVIWRRAKEENDFCLFAPYLEKIVAMSREKAELIGYKNHPYDALLDSFEPEMTTKEISTLFGGLCLSITSLLEKILSRPQVDDSCLHGKFPAEKQLEFGKMLLKEMGYDLEKGRLDISSHPFSMSMHPSDSRITTRIHATSLFDSLSAVLHEGGHSLYEMGLVPEYYGSPICEAVSLGIHESQSRFWETRIGQSRAFWKHFLPLLKKVFDGKLEKVSLDTFYRAVNKVAPSFTRVEADEVTYSLHVIVRFKIEKALIEGSLEVSEIPEAWNTLMEDFLKIRPKTDAQGCLQDIHWSLGAFGYFPTYTLGNLYAAQFFETFEKTHPDWQERVSKGDLLFIKEWLNETIHKHGRYYSAKDLVKKVTGKSLAPTAYISYLTKKYQEIYGF